MLRADREKTHPSSGSTDVPDIVECYADGWRALRDDAGTRPRRAVEAARQWLLSQDPTAFPALRGDLFTTVTITENGKKKAVPGLTHEQLHILQTRHRWCPPDVCIPCEDNSQRLECPICFMALDKRSP